MRLSHWILKLVREDEGISSVEYALLLALIGAAIVGAAALLGTAVANRIGNAANIVNTGSVS